MIKTYINKPYKKMKRKGKNPACVSRTTLCTQKNNFCIQKFFLEKNFYPYNIRFAFEKTKENIPGRLHNYLEKVFVSASKKAIHTISIYGN